MPGAPDTFAHDVWNRQANVYTEMWDYFNRDVFDETVKESSDDKKYPLGINLFETACSNHRAALLGEFGDEVLRFRVESRNQDKNEIEQTIKRIMSASSLGALMVEGGLLCEVFGGMVVRVVYDPWRQNVRIRMVNPANFYPIWDPEDYHRLLEVYVGTYVDARTAFLKYHVDVGTRDGTNQAVVVEHWTSEMYEVTVDGEPAYWDMGRRYPMSGVNVFKDASGQGIIPFEYFARDRAGDFYGTPLGKNALRIQDEYNLRHTDVGDAVMAATHKATFVRNRPKGTKGLEHLHDSRVKNLGMNAPGRDAPEVFALSTGEVPEVALAWLKDMRDTARTSMFTPPVSYGQDEGSQRSALTLAFRMWPLTSVVRSTRGLWASSFDSLIRKVIVVAASKGLGYNLNLRYVQDSYRYVSMWAPMLPRDREGEVNEVVVRKQSGLISIETALVKLEDREGEWIDAEVKRIKADQKFEADLLAQGMGTSGFGGAQQNKSGSSRVPDK
jgi:hypothetical protein